MSKLQLFLFGLLLASSFVACEGNVEKCPQGDPTPIFSDELPTVSYHKFQLNGQKSVEDIGFESGVDLQILQEGCAEIVQEFRFTVDGDYSTFPDSMWLKEASKQFYFLGGLGNKQKALQMWGDAIEQARTSMKLGETAEIAPSVFLKIDKVLGSGESTLLVTMEQK